MAANPYLEILRRDQPPAAAPAQRPASPKTNPYMRLVAPEPTQQDAPSPEVDSTKDTVFEMDSIMGDIRGNAFQRGMQQSVSDFYTLLRKGVTLARKGVEFDESVDEKMKIGVPSVLQLVSRGADHLVETFGGTKQGALNLLEEKLGEIAKAVAPPPRKEGEKENISQQIAGAIGRLPLDIPLYATTWSAGGIPGMAALGLVNAADEDALGMATGTARGAAEGMFFKWMESLVPTVPRGVGEKVPHPDALPTTKNLAVRGERLPDPSLPPEGQHSKLKVTVGEDGQPVVEMIRHADEVPGIKIAEPITGEVPANLDWIQKSYTKVLREIFPLEKYAKMVGDDEIVNLTRNSVGNVSHVQHFLEYGGYDPITKAATGTKGFAQILSKLPKGKWRQLEEYMVAKRGMEDFLPRGLKTADSPESLAAAVAKYEQDDVLRKAATELWQFQDDVLRYGVRSGLVSEESYAAIKAQNTAYVPYFREGFFEPPVKAGARGLINNPIKAIKGGSERPVVSPLRQIIRQTAKIITEADKNRVGMTLARTKDVPNARNWIIRSERGGASAGPTTPGGRSRPGGSPALPGNEQVKLLEDLTVEVGPVTPSEMVVQGVPKNFHRYRIMNNGVEEHYFIDPDLANAIGAYGEAADKFVNSYLIKAFSLPAQALRAGTVDNPGFSLIKNPVRDQFVLHLQSRTGAKFGFSLFDGMYSLAKRDNAYRFMLKTGGTQSNLVSMDRPAFRRIFQEMMDPSQASAWNRAAETMLTPLRALQAMSQFVEQSSRMGEMKAGLRQIGGGSVEQGIQKATPKQAEWLGVATKDVTTDFGLRGSSQAVQAWSKVTAFFNAQLQGADRFVREHVQNPVKAAIKGSAYLTLPTVALHSMQMQDEEYREAYAALPNWRKVLFWNLSPKLFGLETSDNAFWHGRMISVPIPFEWGLIYKAPAEAMVTYHMTHDPGAFKEVGEQLFNTNPLVQLQNGRVTVRGPTVLQPILDIQANRKSFFDVPLHSKAELELPKREQFDPNTPELAKLMSDWMGNYYSPKEIEHLTVGITGAMGRAALRAPDAVMGTNKNYGDIPSLRPFADNMMGDLLFGSLVSRTFEEGSSQAVTDFWNKFNDLNPENNATTTMVREGNAPRMEKQLKRTEATQAAAATIKVFANQIWPLYRQREQILRNRYISGTEKRNIIRSLNANIHRLATLGNQQVDAALNPQEPSPLAKGTP